jgi:hypothetical protein
MRYSAKSVALVLWLVALVSSTAAGAAVFNVDDTADLVDANLADGVCSTAVGTCTLRAAVQQANALTGAGTDTINVPAGTYRLTLAGTGEDAAAQGDLDITDVVDIFGAGPELTTIDGGGLDRVFHVHAPAAASISGVRIQGGAAVGAASPDFMGGGIFLASGSSLDLADCALAGNSSNAGGAIFAQNATSTAVSDCSFRGNSALDLGFTNAQGSALLTEGTTDLDRVEVSGNSTVLTSATVLGLNAASLSLRNTTVSGNQGIGLRVQNTELDLVNSTVFGNTSNGFSFFSFDGSHALTVRNSILANNGGPDCMPFDQPAVMDFPGEHNLDSDGSCPLDDVAPTVDLPSTDPQLGPLAFHGGRIRTHVPLVGSPVIDAGNNDRCESPDQRGAPRPLDVVGGGAVCDLGAVEVLPCESPFEEDAVLAPFAGSGPIGFEACHTIRNGGTFQVFEGGPVAWRARDLLVLDSGFEVLTNGDFEAILDPGAGSSVPLP